MANENTTPTTPTTPAPAPTANPVDSTKLNSA